MDERPRIAYLLSRYPAVSHTFFLNEVLGLRSLGVVIETASVNLPDRRAEQMSHQEKEEVGRTLYLKGGSKVRMALRVAFLAASHPVVVARGLRTIGALPGLTLTKRAFWLAYLAEALLLGMWMRQNSLRHLHVHFGGAVASVGLLTSVAWEIPYSLTIHGPEELQNTQSYQLRAKLEAATFVVCISDFCRSQLLQLTSAAAWNKFHVVRLGVTESLLDGPAASCEGTGPKRLLCVGRLVPEKGQHILLRAIAELRSRGVTVTLVLAGDGADRQSLEAEVTRLELGGAVEFVGATTHATALQLCRESDMFVLPSFSEGIPVALMEAMALGVPCISTTVAGIPELIRDGQDGLLVPPASVEALAAALERLAKDAALRSRFVESSRQRVRSMYNLSTNQRQLAELFAAKLEPQQAGAA